MSQITYTPERALTVDAVVESPDRRFADLLKRVKTEGLLERDGRIYAPRIAGTFALLATSWAAFFAVGDSWWQIVVAIAMAFAFTQVAFLAHDAGHRQAFASRHYNDWLLLATGNVAVGIASGWWFRNHNAHHAHPNNTDLDPDVGLRFFSYSPGQAGSKRGIDRFISRHQDRLYFPLLTLLGFSLRLESLVVVAKRDVKRPLLEGSLLVVHLALYGWALTTLSLGVAVGFVLVHQMLFGLYLGSTFASNHKGMEMFEGTEPSFLDRQVRTSRNVSGGPVVDYLLGGLNLQIEHHLFPTMPRPNLVKAQPIVKAFCAEVGLPYEERSIRGSVTDVVAYLKSNRPDDH